MNINKNDIRRLVTTSNSQFNNMILSVKSIFHSYGKKMKAPEIESLSTENLLAIQEVESGNAIRKSRLIDLAQ